jgi:hypothetical protein
MPGIYSAQGTAVSFGGTPIGYLTGFDVEAAAGSPTETTSVVSQVVGSGANARVLKQYDATSIEPPKVSLTFWGPPTYSTTDAGLKATLTFTAPGDSFTGEAILLSWSHSGRPGQWSTGAAVFQFTGEPPE